MIINKCLSSHYAYVFLILTFTIHKNYISILRYFLDDLRHFYGFMVCRYQKEKIIENP